MVFLSSDKHIYPFIGLTGELYQTWSSLGWDLIMS